MKRLILGAAVILAMVLPANAVVVTLSVGGTSYTENITAANAMRLQNWAAGVYATIPNPAFTPTCGCPATIANPTPGQSAFQALIQGMKDNVVRWEKDQAKAAIADPAPVN